MKSETLQLCGKLDHASAVNVARFLRDIRGVSKVAITTATASVNVDFDDGITSAQELRAKLQRAGIRLETLEHAEAGMCCGSCGG